MLHKSGFFSQIGYWVIMGEARGRKRYLRESKLHRRNATFAPTLVIVQLLQSRVSQSISTAKAEIARVDATTVSCTLALSWKRMVRKGKSPSLVRKVACPASHRFFHRQLLMPAQLVWNLGSLGKSPPGLLRCKNSARGGGLIRPSPLSDDSFLQSRPHYLT